MSESMSTFLEKKVGPAPGDGSPVIEDTVTLEPYQLNVRARTVSANGAFTLTVPKAERCEGSLLIIYMTARNSTDDITVAGINGGNITLNLAGDYVIALSVGDKWLEVKDGYS